MSKATTIASLIRTAARSEADFVETTQTVLDDEPADRIAEFFDRLNIPRSVGCEEPLSEVPKFNITKERIGSFVEESAINYGIQKFLDRHERKIKWHATHPSLDGAENVMLIMRTGMAATELRLDRLLMLLRSKDELSPMEWAVAREIMNKGYLSFRNFLNLLAGAWIDALVVSAPRDDVSEKLGRFYELIDRKVRSLEDYRVKIEERRLELTVTPEGFPPVKPPNYFGGDLLGRGPWKQFWNQVDAKAHHFREAAG